MAVTPASTPQVVDASSDYKSYQEEIDRAFMENNPKSQTVRMESYQRETKSPKPSSFLRPTPLRLTLNVALHASEML
ncbi:hypothetical protein HYALB_00009986 [Hymenoscyphus albidus]|uniref:Uncharacterized protein n=1 Tax=Hymenoscyphus albidus TaxID=595503 RepID=A0A9N9LZQ4_9HELO|nr:hypothetical protein HYALB_00009986 [Hymenoscyphus albidus]